MTMLDERRAHEIQAAIATVLAEDWDPIGVRDVPEAVGEYEMYVGGIYRLLASGTRPRQLAEYLAAVERVRMGLERVEAAALLPVAEKLWRLNVRLAPSPPAI